MDKQPIIVAFGGISPEHEVSVLTAIQAISALENSRHHTIPLYISKSGQWYTGDILRDIKNYENLKKLTEQAKRCSFFRTEDGDTVLKTEKPGIFSSSEEFKFDAVLTAFHGAKGENGAFQGMCEMFDIPYTGSGIMASAVGMDKIATKRICRSENLPIVEDVDFLEKGWVKNRENYLQKIDRLGYPVVVKPVHLGSSIGVEVVANEKELITAIETSFRYDAHLMVEKAVSPLTEINCSVLGDGEETEVSVCERPKGKEELLSFQDKYQNEESAAKGMASADRVIPADIDPKLTQQIQDTALQVFNLLQGSGLARLDFLVNSETNEFYFNEINTIPGSFSFYLWKESGIDFQSLLEKLISIAIQKHQKINGRIQSYETNLLSQKAVKGMKGLKNPNK